MIANVKHFAVNNQEGRKLANGTVVGNRYTVDARVDERTLMEMYLPQFEAAVKEGHAGSVMCSYNRLNGPHTCENTWLLQQVLRHRWGFKGFVLADYGASKHIGSGLLAGLDFEPFPYVDFDGGENYRPALVAAAIAAHRTTQARVDAAVHHVLRTLFAYRFFDRAAYVDDDSRVDRTGHAEEARRLAEAGTVLLKNKGGVLPLARPQAEVAGDHRRRRRHLQERRRLVEHPALLVRDAARRDHRPRRARRRRALRPGRRPRPRGRRWRARRTPPWSWWPTRQGRGRTSPASRSTADPSTS